MQDLNSLSDEQLMAIVNQGATQQKPSDQTLEYLQSLSDEQLLAIVNSPNKKQEENSGLLSRIAESFTGNARRTPIIDALPDWRGNMPEFSISQGLPALKTSLGTMMTGPDETAKIIKSNFPDVEVKQDEKGNYIFKSGIDGKEYALKPGFTASDVPRAIAGILAFSPAGRATTLLGAGAAAGATQAVIEGSQVATGGEFNLGDIGAAAVLGSAGEAAAKILGVAIPGARRLLQGKSFIPEDIAATVPAVSPEAARTDLVKIIDKASSESLSASKYKRQLAEVAKVNPEALQAAMDLGIDLPPDVFSDNPQVRALVGMARTVKGSEAEAAWRESVMNAVQKSDAALEGIEGAVSPSTVSEKALQSLKASRDELKSQTSSMYSDVESQVPKNTVISAPVKKPKVAPVSEAEAVNQQLNERIARATGKYVEPEAVVQEFEGPGLPNLEAVLKQTVENRGGISGLTPQEKSLLDMVKSEKVTWDRLLLEKNDLRRALRGKNTPYSNLDQSIVENLYQAISKDQLNAVEKIAGQEVSDKLVAANLLYTKQKQLEKTLVDAFGKELNQSIAPVMSNFVSQAKVGNVTALNKLLAIVPENLQKEAVLSSIFNASKAKDAAFKGQFGMAQFNDIWTSFNQHPEILSKVKQIIGPEATGVLDSLGRVAKVITNARSVSESTTGASLQPLVQQMRAKTFVNQILNQTTLAWMGSKVGGLPGAALGTMLAKSMERDRFVQMARLFNSSEFQDVVKQIAVKSKVGDGVLSDFAKSGVFSKFAQMIKLPANVSGKVNWLKHAMLSQQDMLVPQSAFAPDRVVAEVLPNGKATSDPVTKFKIVQKTGGKYRLLAPDGTVSVFDTEQQAIKAATKKLRMLTNSPLR